MRKSFWLIPLLLLLLPAALWAETYRIAPGLTVEIALPSERWTVSQSPPSQSIAELAEHLKHDLEAQGKEATEEQLREVARKRLAANELFVFNSATGAHLDVDFSPLREGESPPSQKSVETSARYAGEGLGNEEGVSGVIYRVKKTEVSGAEAASRFDAEYSHHGEKRVLVGIVGFVQPYWFYLYYTDLLQDPQDRVEMEKILETLKIRISPAAGE